MNQQGATIVGFERLIVVGLIGGMIGFIVAGLWNPLPLTARSRIAPAPYRLPKIPGGTSLRMAMVHDILHERYLRHGTAWYLQRNIDSRKIIQQAAPATQASPSQQYLDALDDLAIGLERTGNYDQAIAIMRHKLLLVSPLPPAPATRPATMNASQSLNYRDIDKSDLERILAAQNLSPFQHQQYTTVANLGTILVHSFMHHAIQGDAAAESQVREGLGYIEQSVAINPGAHFGRETWQAIAIEDLLASIDHPELLTDCDLFGDPMDYFTGENVRPWGLVRHPVEVFDENLTPEQRLDIRARIDRIGIYVTNWADIVQSHYPASMPFDEPTLAIIGMWTLGGGPNPHFALTLGRIMENVGQRQIAWNAYERAVEMKDQFWPAPAICEKMVALCRTRQGALAKIEEPGDPSAWQDKMRKEHVGELEWGQTYQKAYQDYEAAQIAAGVTLNSPDFYKAFFQNRPSIASPPGFADDVVITNYEASSLTDFLPCMLLGAGIAMAIQGIKMRK